VWLADGVSPSIKKIAIFSSFFILFFSFQKTLSLSVLKPAMMSPLHFSCAGSKTGSDEVFEPAVIVRSG
jgi:hypothetical protein